MRLIKNLLKIRAHKFERILCKCDYRQKAMHL